MKILFFSRLFAPHIGGVEKHTEEIAHHLAKRGHHVTIVSEKIQNWHSNSSGATGSSDDVWIVAKPQTYRKKSEKNGNKIEICLGSVQTYTIPVPTNEFLKKWSVWWWLWKHRNLIKDADLVHCHDVFFWYLPFRFLYRKKPVYTTFHGYETVFPPRRRAALIRRLSEKLSWGNICVGDYIRRWYGTKPTYVTYGGVGILPIHTNTTNNYKSTNTKLRILFVGRLEEDTGVLTYLKVLKELKRRRVAFEFEACGDGPLRAEFDRYGKVHGYVSDLSNYLGWSDIVFASSYLTILEALAAKKLVFSVYDNPLKKDYLTLAPFARYIIIEKEPAKLVEKILFYRKNKQAADELVGQGYEWVKDETWRKVTSLYLQLWKK